MVLAVRLALSALTILLKKNLNEAVGTDRPQRLLWRERAE